MAKIVFDIFSILALGGLSALRAPRRGHMEEAVNDTQARYNDFETERLAKRRQRYASQDINSPTQLFNLTPPQNIMKSLKIMETGNCQA